MADPANEGQRLDPDIEDAALRVRQANEGQPVANIPENMDAPCNICGRGWPYHAEACSYAAHLRERNEARDSLARVTQELDEARAALQFPPSVEGANTLWRDAAALARERSDRLETALREGKRFLRVFDSVAQDENDGEIRLYSDIDLHNAAAAFRVALASVADR